MTPTGKFTKTVNPDVTEEKISSQPTVKQQERFIGTNENRDVLLEKLGDIFKQSAVETNHTKKS